jgi:hypothetical protein
VYRHLSKTGGTTARFVFDRQTVFGDFEYPLEYGFDEKKWDDLLSRWRKKADAFLANTENENADASPPPRTLVEIRGNWPSNWPAEAFEGRILTDVETLRFQYGENSSSSAEVDDALASSEHPIRKKSCSVTTSLMLRDPFKQYESFWRYYIEKKQTLPEVTDGTTRDENLALKKWPDADGVAFWGDSFAEWASRVPSMQIREALGNKCVAQMRQPGFDAEFRDGTWVRTGNHSFDAATCDREVTELDFRRFERLLRRIDVVGVTEKFDAFLLRLAEVVGLRRLEYVKSNASRKNADENESLSVDESSESPRNEKRDASETERISRAVVSEVARWDIQAHVLAKRTQEEEINRNAIGGAEGFEERLRTFESKTAVLGGKTFVGGVPKRSPYVWVKSAEVKASGGVLKPVVPESFTDETGGGQAVAYIVFDPVTLVHRDDAEKSGAACVKGCTFDAPT